MKYETVGRIAAVTHFRNSPALRPLGHPGDHCGVALIGEPALHVDVAVLGVLRNLPPMGLRREPREPAPHREGQEEERQQEPFGDSPHARSVARAPGRLSAFGQLKRRRR